MLQVHNASVFLQVRQYQPRTWHKLHWFAGTSVAIGTLQGELLCIVSPKLCSMLDAAGEALMLVSICPDILCLVLAVALPSSLYA